MFLYKQMRIKLIPLIIFLLLVSFCGGEETQTEICEYYLMLLEQRIDLDYENITRDFYRITEMYSNNELSEALARNYYANEFDEEIEDLVTILYTMNPNEENELNHIEIIRNLEEMENALVDMIQWVDTKDDSFAKNGILSFQDADKLIQNVFNNLTCPVMEN